MDILSSEFLNIFFQLVPGFIASWVFYGLTPIGKPDQLDRIVNALIYSTLIQVTVYLLSQIFILVGEHWVTLSPWTSELDLIYSIILAFILGIMLSHSTNHDSVHKVLRSLKVTMADSYPSQWYEEMIKNKGYILLTLVDGRRIYGYPVEPAESPDLGHFILSPYIWLTEQNENGNVVETAKTDEVEEDVEIHVEEFDPTDPIYWSTSKILIASDKVDFVEFINEEQEDEEN